MNTDATPSWSGYIFQGEVALCRAIETMNSLPDPIPDGYCLKLEEDEDFSLQTTEIEVFQVKAYLSKDADKISKYKEVIEELIDKYYYHKRVEKDPNDGRKRNHIYFDRVRKKPVKCNLITDSVITDFQPDLSNFDNKYSKATNFECLQGEYTIANIHLKLMDAVTQHYAESGIAEEDAAIKTAQCCYNITRIVKERHASKKKTKIFFKDIKQWMDSALAFSEDLCWFEISKLFLKFLSEDLVLYDLNDAGQLAEFTKLQAAVDELEKLPYNDLISLIQFHTTPHKKLDKNNLRQSFAGFLEGSAVRSVVLKAIKEIIQLPYFKNLQYTKMTPEGQAVRYQLLNHNSEFDDSMLEQIRFQQHCEEFYKHPNTIDVDLFVTRHLSHSQQEIRDKITNILDPHATEEEINKRLFGFSSIEKTINDINK
jgi:hypothetical protein